MHVTGASALLQHAPHASCLDMLFGSSYMAVSLNVVDGERKRTYHCCDLKLHAGGVCQGLAMPFNLGPVRNALAIWLGIEPADLFLYIFLPPMLLDAAVRIDYFLFKKVILSAIFDVGMKPDACFTAPGSRT